MSSKENYKEYVISQNNYNKRGVCYTSLFYFQKFDKIKSFGYNDIVYNIIFLWTRKPNLILCTKILLLAKENSISGASITKLISLSSA